MTDKPAFLWLTLIGGIVLAAAGIWAYVGQPSVTEVGRPNSAAESTLDILGPAYALSAEQQITLPFVAAVIEHMSAPVRDANLQSNEAFQALVTREQERLALLKASIEANTHLDPSVQYLMQRAAEQVLVESFLLAQIARNPSPALTDQQLAEFYQANLQSLTVPQRVELWQIFVPIESGSQPEAASRIQTVAANLVKALKDGQLSFSQAAIQFSSHAPSRDAGGYLGLVPLHELQPEIREVVSGLAVNEISAPVVGKDGVHILKRGGIVPAVRPSFERAKPRIERSALESIRVSARRALLDEALKWLARSPTGDEVEAWRVELRQRVHRGR